MALGILYNKIPIYPIFYLLKGDYGPQVACTEYGLYVGPKGFLTYLPWGPSIDCIAT